MPQSHELRRWPHSELNIVVLTCGNLGLELALNLRQTAGVSGLSVVVAPYQPARSSPLDRVRRLYTMDGPAAVAKAVLSRALGANGNSSAEALDTSTWRQRALDAGIPVIDIEDFNAPSGVAAINAQQADVGIIAGTYILKEPAFAAPALGSINIHSGKAPEYRGSAPAFWELYNGETSVGVTIHWAVTRLDAGNILRQQTFPLDPAPLGDPARYIDTYRSAVLRPNAMRLVLEAIDEIRQGRGLGTPQAACSIKPYRLPTYAQKRELARRVSDRRHAVLTSGAA